MYLLSGFQSLQSFMTPWLKIVCRIPKLPWFFIIFWLCPWMDNSACIMKKNWWSILLLIPFIIFYVSSISPLLLQYSSDGNLNAHNCISYGTTFSSGISLVGFQWGLPSPSRFWYHLVLQCSLCIPVFDLNWPDGDFYIWLRSTLSATYRTI